MRIGKFTQKMQEALQTSQDAAAKAQHAEISNEHFLLALLEQAEGVARPLRHQPGHPELVTPRCHTAPSPYGRGDTVPGGSAGVLPPDR